MDSEGFAILYIKANMVSVCLSVVTNRAGQGLSVLATDSKSKSENKQIMCNFEVYKNFEALKAHI